MSACTQPAAAGGRFGSVGEVQFESLILGEGTAPIWLWSLASRICSSSTCKAIM